MQSINVLSHMQDSNYIKRECTSKVLQYMSFVCGAEIHPSFKKYAYQCGMMNLLHDMHSYFTNSVVRNCTCTLLIRIERAHQYMKEESRRLFMVNNSVRRERWFWSGVGMYTGVTTSRKDCLNVIKTHVHTIRTAFMRIISVHSPLSNHSWVSLENEDEPDENTSCICNDDPESPVDHRYIEPMIVIDDTFVESRQ